MTDVLSALKNGHETYGSLCFEPEMADMLRKHIGEVWPNHKFGQDLVTLGILSQTDIISIDTFLKKMVSTKMPLIYLFWTLANSSFPDAVKEFIVKITLYKNKTLRGLTCYENLKFYNQEDRIVLETLLYYTNLQGLNNLVFQMANIGGYWRDEYFLRGEVELVIDELVRFKRATVSWDSTFNKFLAFIQKCGMSSNCRTRDFELLKSFVKTEQFKNFMIWSTMVEPYTVGQITVLTFTDKALYESKFTDFVAFIEICSDPRFATSSFWGKLWEFFGSEMWKKFAVWVQMLN